MKKSNKYLSILFLSCTIIAPFLLWINYFAYPNRIESTSIGELISWSIYSIFFLFPFFFVYQIILKIQKKIRKLNFKLTMDCRIFFLCLAILYYKLIYYKINKQHK